MVMFYSKIIQGAQYYRSKVLKYQNKIGREGGELFLWFYEDDTTILELKLVSTLRLREPDSESKLTLICEWAHILMKSMFRAFLFMVSCDLVRHLECPWEKG